MRRIHNISYNEEVIKVIRDIAEKLRSSVATFSIRDVKVSPYGSEFQSGDLVIIDASLALTRTEIHEALSWASSQKQRFGTFTLLVWPYPGRVPGDIRIFDVDAQLSVNLVTGRDGAERILRFLYRKFRPSSRRLWETEEVLRLMGARATSILLGELIQVSDKYEVQANPEANPEEWLLDAREIMSDKDFNRMLAGRLANELEPLLWVYVAEALITLGAGKFDALGKFELSYTSGDLSILFDSDGSFEEGTAPELEFSVMGLSERNAIGVAAAFPHYPVLMYNLLAVKAVSRESWEPFLAEAYWNVARSVAGDELEKTGSNLPSRIAVLGHAAALIGYYSTVVAASRSVLEDKKLDVPMIGSFFREGATVKFKATRELLDLIDANPRAISAGA